MSKRKMLKLVNGGYVEGWDDPRMYTLIGLRRRGVPPGAILAFVNALGVTTHNSTIQTNRFDQTVRQYLEHNTPRLMMLVDPVRVTLENVPEDFLLEIEKPLHPKVPAMGTAKLPFTRTLYIDRSDFRTQDSKEYFRLAPGKSVGLYQVPNPITCTSFRTDESGKVTELVCRYEPSVEANPPQTYIQWVAEHTASGSPVAVDQVRLFHPLFTCENPAAEDNFLEHINPRSVETFSNALIEPAFYHVARAALRGAREDVRQRTAQAEEQARHALGQERLEHDAAKEAIHTSPEETIGKECVRFQAMRVGYFAVDKESAMELFGDRVADGKDRIVLNRIVSLKEDAGKQSSDPAAASKSKMTRKQNA